MLNTIFLVHYWKMGQPENKQELPKPIKWDKLNKNDRAIDVIWLDIVGL